MARKAKASKLKTPLAVLKSNERYREGFIQKAIRFDRIEDFDLLQAIEADKLASFNATIISLLRKKYKLDSKVYRAEQAEKIEAMKEKYRSAIAFCWNENDKTFEENLDQLNEYMKANHQIELKDDPMSEAFISNQLKVLGMKKGIIRNAEDK
ncbi:hypothetical protein A9299_07650 [Moraxella osloensis]|uniref:Uncharacterized protein n=1 Tax=Faucicola osloensis TaxID=34062 RepID=A0AA91JAG3_FAUOS|nr:hypothetical protein [Moraxella osloensis]OBX65814.1 hypothetical protein A9299_07650 [Moraxella osloensis]